MKQIQQFIEALESLTSNKLRSGLTILGIVIGVAAVIAMLSIGQGAQASINNSIQSIGTNLLFVSPGGQNVTNPRPLTEADATALVNPVAAPDVQSVAAVVQGRGTVVIGGKTTSTEVQGVTPGYASIRALTTTEGSFITDAQMNGRTTVAVLGSTVATNLFGRTTNLVGQVVRINGQPFRVSGVLASKGGSGLGNADDTILVPLTTAQTRLFPRSPAGRVDQIIIQATQANRVTQANAEVTQILRVRHEITGSTNDFSILNQQDILSSANSITGVLTLFLGGIAAISLLVGGIGIMNIMLVSVTERTREIGLRKAIGARKFDILFQFLTESALLSLIGGVVGIGLAWVITQIIKQIAASSSTPFTPIIGIDSILMATVFSAVVGIFFGFYPAFRAANLQPAEALRSE